MRMTCVPSSISSITPDFSGLSSSTGWMTNAFLSRLPLTYFPKKKGPRDLHALDTSLAFDLSQDQTLNNSTRRTEPLMV